MCVFEQSPNRTNIDAEKLPSDPEGIVADAYFT